MGFNNSTSEPDFDDEPREKKKFPWLLVGIIALLIIGLVGAWLYNNSTAAHPATPVADIPTDLVVLATDLNSIQTHTPAAPETPAGPVENATVTPGTQDTAAPTPAAETPQAEPTEIDWSLCKAEDPATYPSAEYTYWQYFKDMSRTIEIVLKDAKGKDVKVPAYEINLVDVSAFAKKYNGYVIFQGRLLTLAYTETVLTFRDVEEGNTDTFVYREGSFWFFSFDRCPDTREARLVNEYQLAAGKWQSQESGNATASLEGFTSVILDPETHEVLASYTLENPFVDESLKITGLSGTAQSCKDLEEPVLQVPQGLILDDTVKSVAFGARNCDSVIIGDLAGGYQAKFIRDAEDNVKVKDNANLRHFVFPAFWGATEIQTWLDANYPGIKVTDPEGVLQ